MKTWSIPAAMFVAAIVASAALAQQLPEVTPQPPVPAKGTVAQGVEDGTITAKVQEAISADPALKDMQFTVATADSVVTLSGTAPASDQVARALAIARAVPGVKSVINILAVVKPS
jgi:osmotically-inducible protein OsmY